MVARRYDGKSPARHEPDLTNRMDEPKNGGNGPKRKFGEPEQTDRESYPSASGRRKPELSKDQPLQIIRRIEDFDRKENEELDAMLKRAMEPLLTEDVPDNLKKLIEGARRKFKKQD